MLRGLIAISTATTLALTLMPSSVTGALELKGKQKKQGMLLPAVQKVRESGKNIETKGSGQRSVVRTSTILLVAKQRAIRDRLHKRAGVPH